MLEFRYLNIFEFFPRGSIMVLSDRTIKEELRSGRIVISPLDPDDLQPASANLHLDRNILGRKYQGQTVPTASRFHRDFARRESGQAS